MKKCSLVLYNPNGKKIKYFEHGSIYKAVEQGYDSNCDFIVRELEGEVLRMYWNGRTTDKSRPDFYTWRHLAEEIDIT